jgi:hypothetical protein
MNPKAKQICKHMFSTQRFLSRRWRPYTMYLQRWARLSCGQCRGMSSNTSTRSNDHHAMSVCTAHGRGCTRRWLQSSTTASRQHCAMASGGRLRKKASGFLFKTTQSFISLSFLSLSFISPSLPTSQPRQHR